jgi:hypothetical protein
MRCKLGEMRSAKCFNLLVLWCKKMKFVQQSLFSRMQNTEEIMHRTLKMCAVQFRKVDENDVQPSRGIED